MAIKCDSNEDNLAHSSSASNLFGAFCTVNRGEMFLFLFLIISDFFYTSLAHGKRKHSYIFIKADFISVVMSKGFRSNVFPCYTPLHQQRRDMSRKFHACVFLEWSIKSLYNVVLFSVSALLLFTRETPKSLSLCAMMRLLMNGYLWT